MEANFKHKNLSEIILQTFQILSGPILNSSESMEKLVVWLFLLSDAVILKTRTHDCPI